MKYFFIIFISLGFLFSCGVKDSNNVYLILEKGGGLEKNLLFESSQIIENGTDVLIVADIFNNEMEYNPHIFFYKKNKLISASYLPSEYIQLNKFQEITGDLNEEREKRGGKISK